ncbi:MAG TPA: twin-arginine translocase TatA/TatE family subunit [Bellilinea sp.]|nr:twin-arginine translocase TatA/TatE family subunit [Bellilinea sp.]
MLRNFSGWEILVVLAIVLLLFGVGRIGKIGGELGSGIRAFRKGIKDGDEEKPEENKKAEPENK